MYGLFQSMEKSKDREEDNVEVIDYDSDKEDQFEDASDSINEGEGPNDLTRPSEWRPKDEMDKEEVDTWFGSSKQLLSCFC